MVVLLRTHQRAERPLDDLAQRRMDVDGIEHGPGALGRGVHQIDDLLNEDGGMGTDDVRPQDLQRVPCHDDLHKVVPYVHRLSLRGVLIPLETDQDLRLAELLDGLLFFESYPRDFGIHEDGVRDRVVLDLTLLLRNSMVKPTLVSLFPYHRKKDPHAGSPPGSVYAGGAPVSRGRKSQVPPRAGTGDSSR